MRIILPRPTREQLGGCFQDRCVENVFLPICFVKLVYRFGATQKIRTRRAMPVRRA